MNRVHPARTKPKAAAALKQVNPSIRRRSAGDPDGYRLIVEAVGSALLLCDDQGRVRLGNIRSAALFGFHDPADFAIRAVTLQELLPANEAERWAADLAEASERGKKAGMVYRLAGKDGTEFFGEISITRVKGREKERIIEIRDVTESLRAQQAIEESEKRYRMLAEKSRDIICILDRDEAICYVNPIGANYLGLRAEQMIGQSRFVFFNESPIDHEDSIFHKVISSGAARYSENQTVLKGNTFSFGTWLIPLFNEERRVDQVLLIARDITDRVRAQKELRLSEERFRNTVKRTLDGYVFADAAGFILYVNEAMSQILGYKRHELVGQNFLNFLSESYVSEVRRTFSRVMGGHTLSRMDVSMRQKSGRFIWITFNGRRVVQDGRVIGVESFIRNTTNAKKSLEALQQSEARFRSLFSHIPLEVFDLTPKGRIRTANPLFLKNWGDAIGRLLAEVPADESIQRLFQHLVDSVLQQRQTVQYNYSLMRGGHPVYYATTLSPILTSDGTLVGLVGLNLNNTKQIENYQRMRRLSARLVRVQEEERAHLSREIHDSLGQYLSALQMEVGALTAISPIADEKIAQMLENTKVTINEAVRVSRSMVQLLRTPVLDDFGLQAAVLDFISELEKKWQYHITLKSIHLEVPLPREVETTLYRVLQEACTNVLKHGKTNEIEIRLKRMTQHVSLAVRDHGVGFDTHEVALGQEHFGLFSMKERVELLGGRFRILSKPQQGVLVIARIPCQGDEQK